MVNLPAVIIGSWVNNPFTLVGILFVQRELGLRFRQEVDDVFRAAVDLGVAALAAEAFDVGDGHPDDAHLGEGFLHLVEFEGFDDRFDTLHGQSGGKVGC